MLQGCASSTVFSKDEARKLEYTVVREWDVPQELVEEIEGKKEQGFRISYLNDEYLYIAYGLGERESGGYSIQVKDCVCLKNAIEVSFESYGPQKGELVSEQISYPYIVIKTEAMDLPVIFD